MTLAPDTFAYVADLVRRRSALNLQSGKEYLVESRLLPLARAEGRDVDAYVRALRAAPHPTTLETVVEALTTNETSWFRDSQPFKALVDHVVPAVTSASAHLPLAARPPLRIWSAACSSGQEPYSIAMALADAVPLTQLRIIATDLSQRMVERGRAGRYSQLEVNRGLPAPMLVKHFSRAGAEWEVAAGLRNAVRFERHNLLDAPPVGGPFDVVFMRNVLIYFDLAAKREALARVRRVLKPGGYLLLGAAETTIGVDEAWDRVPVGGGSIYRLTPGRAA
ncbi:MAG TPA: protein-glutamate O-methyltransferase CheR [Actinotalea sp.]